MNICQSCGMSLVNKKFCGTNKDGSLNNEYCKFCFADGKFRDEGISMQEKINRNISMAIKMGMNEEKARKIANSIIPKLKRWK